MAESKTKLLTNDDYDWVGSGAIKIYSVDTVAMGNYTRSGANRYGSPSELGTTLTNLDSSKETELSQQQLIAGTMTESNFVTEAGKFLARQLRDRYSRNRYLCSSDYRYSRPITEMTLYLIITTASNAYVDFLAMNADISDNQAPEDGRVAVMTAQYYNFLKQSGFVLD